MRIIHDDPPMREEIASGFYQRFEARWHAAELWGRAAMLVFVAVCGVGLLGQGPLSGRVAENPDGSIAIHYEPVVRNGAPTTILLDTRVPPGGDKVAVTIAKELVDQFSLENLTPQPARWEAGDHGIRLEFPIQPGAGRVFLRFAGSPSFRGSVHMWARLDKGETLSWFQYSVP